ncbi:hypothetical protein EON63_21945 [archaeon]|nr:MAG: hypothetical protein EON63_21945 [archaeon]
MKWTYNGTQIVVHVICLSDVQSVQVCVWEHNHHSSVSQIHHTHTSPFTIIASHIIHHTS